MEQWISGNDCRLVVGIAWSAHVDADFLHCWGGGEKCGHDKRQSVMRQQRVSSANFPQRPCCYAWLVAVETRIACRGSSQAFSDARRLNLPLTKGSVC